MAYQYGFESHEGFTRSFKRFFGFSPKVIKDQKVDYVIPNYFVINERRSVFFLTALQLEAEINLVKQFLGRA